MSDERTYEQNRDQRWYRPDIPTDERYRYVLSTAAHIRKNQLWRRELDIQRVRLYGSTAHIASGVAGTSRPTIGMKRKVGYNVVACIADARVAKITKEKPKVSVVTEEGDWELEEKAKGMEAFIEGQFYEMDLYERGTLLVLDGDGIFGKGFWKFFIDGTGEEARICVDRVLPFEMLCDEQENLRANPQNLMQESWVDRNVLAECYKDDAEKFEKIMKAKSGHDPDLGTHLTVGYDSTADQVLAVESWHLRPGRRSKEGKHCLCIEGVTLEDEEWEYDFFPFVTYSGTPSPLGWWGIPITDRLDGIQQSINDKLMRVEKGLKMLGAGHILVHSASKVDFSAWDNDSGSKIRYTGVKPELFMPAEVVPAQMTEMIDRDYSKAFGLTGTPEPEAQGMVPSNLESGKAQQVHLDVTDQRIQVAINRYHAAFLRAAHLILAFGREIVEKHNPKFQSKCAGKGGLRKVLLSEVDLTENECMLKMWPTNALSDDPSERMAQVQTLENAGRVDPDQASRLLDYPDLKEAQSLSQASYDAVEQCISEMLNHGRYKAPIPNLFLDQAEKQVNLALIKAWRQGRPEARIQLLRDWLDDAAQLPRGPGGQPAVVQNIVSAGGAPAAAAPAAGITPATTPPTGGPPGPMAPPQGQAA